MIARLTLIFMIVILYVGGGLVVEQLFNSHPMTAFFGLCMGYLSLFCCFALEERLNKEQENV